MKHQIYNKFSLPSQNEKNQIIDFLVTHLGKYGDPQIAIERTLNFKLEDKTKQAKDFTIVTRKNDKIIGAAIVIQSGMGGNNPKHILAYLATHKKHRYKGIGKYLLKNAIKITKGDIILFVEPDNPARLFYKKLGFKGMYRKMHFENQFNN